MRRLTALIALTALLSGCATVAIPNEFASSEKMVRDASTSVANIIGGNFMGTGFLITHDGYLLSSYHLIRAAGKNEFLITFGGSYYTAKFVASYAKLDLALLKMNGDFPHITIPQDYIDPVPGEPLLMISRDQYGNLVLHKGTARPSSSIPVSFKYFLPLFDIYGVFEDGTEGGTSGSLVMTKNEPIGINIGRTTDWKASIFILLSWRDLEDLFPVLKGKQ